MMRHPIVAGLLACLLAACGSTGSSAPPSTGPAVECPGGVPSSSLVATTARGLQMIGQAGPGAVLSGTGHVFASAVAISHDRCRVAFSSDEASALDSKGDTVGVWRAAKGVQWIPHTPSVEAPASLSWSPGDSTLAMVSSVGGGGLLPISQIVTVTPSGHRHVVTTLSPPSVADSVCWIDRSHLAVLVSKAQSFDSRVEIVALDGQVSQRITPSGLGAALLDAQTLGCDTKAHELLLAVYRTLSDFQHAQIDLVKVAANGSSPTVIDTAQHASEGVLSPDATGLAYIVGTPSTPQTVTMFDAGDHHVLRPKLSAGYAIAWG